MTLPDDEFDDFLARRKHVFRRRLEDPLEPPGELDRIVLREAREAIQSERPARVHRGPHWAAPLAIAATVVLAVTVILNVGLPHKQEPVAEVTVQTVAQNRELAPAPVAAAERTPDSNNSARAMSAPAADAAVETERARSEVATGMRPAAPGPAPANPGGFVAAEEGDRYASAPASQPVPSDLSLPPTEAGRAMAKATPTPPFRRDSKTWLAEIERLRAGGNHAQADAEYLEYKRQHRAYAGSPDR